MTTLTKVEFPTKEGLGVAPKVNLTFRPTLRLEKLSQNCVCRASMVLTQSVCLAGSSLKVKAVAEVMVRTCHVIPRCHHYRKVSHHSQRGQN